MNPKHFIPLGGFGLLLLGGFIWYKHKHMATIAPINKRLAVVNAAMNEVGSNDTTKYWSQAAPGAMIAKGTSWCGAFALWALKQAGLGLSWIWSFGTGGKYGFLYHLPTTKDPQPGDIAYVDQPYQHHAIVHSVNLDGTVSLINGNGTGGKVSLSNTPKSHVTAFFSIEPLVAA